MKRIIIAFTILFSLFLTQPRSALAAPMADGCDPQPNGRVEAFAVQPDGKILLGGGFTTLCGQPRNYIGRFNTDGSLDMTFNPDALAGVGAIAVQPDGKILVGGNFYMLAGEYRHYIGRLNPDGSLDTTFKPESNGTVHTLVVQPDGKILVGGIFSILAGQTRYYLGRLNTDGTLDSTFNARPGGWVFTLGLQPDGKILVGGMFGRLNGQTRNYIGRLNADGTLDTAFDPGANSSILSIAVQPEGKILLAGAFSNLSGQARNRIGRLNANGSLDSTFDPGLGASGPVYSMLVRADGKIWLGGSFNNLGGQPHRSVGRLNPDGSLDTAIQLDADETVYSLGLQPDGKLLIGGDFTMLGGVTNNHFGQLAADSPALRELTAEPNGTAITWMHSGSGPDVERVTFEQSLAGGPYSMLGAGVRTTGGWQLTGLNLPNHPTLSIRARGYYSGGIHNGSTAVVDEVVDNVIVDPVQAGPNFTVNTTADHDDGLCSSVDCTLREAITAANTHANTTDPDQIHFNISTGCSAATGVCTIDPTSALPSILQAVIIDGYTQPGASANTLTTGSNARLLIELNGANAPARTDGLTLRSDNTTVTIRGLVINRFKGYGISSNSPNNTIIGNFIGTDAAGTVALGNTSGGISVFYNTTIGGATPEARNLISGNTYRGIFISGADSQVLGNYIGTDATGTQSVGNRGDGIEVSYTANTIIGGVLPGARNLISGNTGRGVCLCGSTSQGNLVQGNFIGTDVTGQFSLGNREGGLWIDNGSNNTIGGHILEARNLISGNGGNGLVIRGDASGNTVVGNYIGTNVSGTAKLANAEDGITIGGSSNIIGGTAALAGNLISGNAKDGISIHNRAANNLVLGNLIGTDVTGTASLGNGANGIKISNGYPVPTTASATIGLPVSGARNIISGNGLDGINIVTFNGNIQGNIVQGNFIGTDISGTTKVGNGRNGISVEGSPNNKLGGTDSGTGNLISGNGANGVQITGNSATGNMVLGNAIFDNAALGIDFTPSDPGPNHMQAFPLLNSYSNGVLDGILNSTADTTFRVEFFANSTCDPSEYGEGEQYLGAQNVTTNGSGQAVFTAVYPPIDGKAYLTASATNSVTGDSSTFSPCLPYIAPTPATANLTIVIQASANPAPAGSSLALTMTASNLGPSIAVNTILNASLPAGLTFLSAAFGEDTPCSLTGALLTCELGDLAVASSQTVTVLLDAPSDASGAYSISATLESDISDPSGDNTAVFNLTIQSHRFFFIPLVSR